MQKRTRWTFLLEALLGFIFIMALWILGIKAGFDIGMKMISAGNLYGYAMAGGFILSAVGVWGVFQIVLKLVFPEAYEQSISYYQLHLLCGAFGVLSSTVFFSQTEATLALIYPISIAICGYLYFKCKRVEVQLTD
ncbi:hypothetical protein [Aliiglaciecola sp. LCG003]|uniref:hypothetical protein n=1 Tax=Aliiglaciecola sp. LCG003 TaxID=3053655 RepID=UPI002572BCFD|nr:hypothetical protein [Aliiglaciecola sp. LCG003]WJG09420.1 hypothetical protein QR722_19155 [Aliiglaciecola sp. LCG003]